MNKYGLCVITSNKTKDKIYQGILDKYLEEHSSEIEDYLMREIDLRHRCLGNGLVE